MTDKTYPLPAPKVPMGSEARDAISGISGIITSVFYKLSGSVMLGLQPKGDGEKMPEAWTVDEQIIELVEGGRTIPALDPGAPLIALGHSVEDRVTKFKGTVTAIVVHINGCISGVVTAPGLTKDGGLIEEYFDQKRLKVTGVGVSAEAAPTKRAATKKTGGFSHRARPSA